MKLTLKTKIFLLVFLSVVLISVPIIFLTYGNLKKISRQFEEESFGNVLLLMEDNISSRYLNMLTTEVMMVLERKIHLQTTSFLAKNTWQDLTWLEKNKKEELLANWEKSLHNFNTFFGLFEKSRLKVSSPYFEVLMRDMHRADFKGVTLSQLLDLNYLPNSGAFAVFTLSEEDCSLLVQEELCEPGDNSLLLFFLPLDEEYVVSFGVIGSDIKKNEQISELAIVESIQEKFDTLALYPNSIVALFSSQKELLAEKGNIKTHDLTDIPDYMLEKAKKEKFYKTTYEDKDIPEGSYFKAWGDSNIRLFYFKALDWYVLAAVPMKEIESHSETMLYRLALVAGIVIVICVLSGLMLAYRIIKPLQILMHKVLGLANADFEHFTAENEDGQSRRILTEFSQDLPVKRTDEVGQLARAFANMGQALETNIENLLHTQAVTQRMQGELNAAREIQLGILKDLQNAEQEDFDVSAFLEPAKEVGGDLYDYFTLEDGRKVLAIGDVSGKGVPAALFMSMTVTLIRYAMRSGLTPCEAMQKINETLSENNHSCMFVTLFIGVLDCKTGELAYANGGHCFPYIVNKNSSNLRMAEKTSGPMVGVLDGVAYEGGSIMLEDGDRVLVYTDGVTEAMNEENALYGEERLQGMLLQQRSKKARSIIEAVYGDILAYRGNAEQSDDITMLCFAYEREKD